MIWEVLSGALSPLSTHDIGDKVPESASQCSSHVLCYKPILIIYRTSLLQNSLKVIISGNDDVSQRHKVLIDMHHFPSSFPIKQLDCLLVILYIYPEEEQCNPPPHGILWIMQNGLQQQHVSQEKPKHFRKCEYLKESCNSYT